MAGCPARCYVLGLGTTQVTAGIGQGCLLVEIGTRRQKSRNHKVTGTQSPKPKTDSNAGEQVEKFLSTH